MPRDLPRERSPTTVTRSYRDRSDAPKRKHRGVSEDSSSLLPPAKKTQVVNDSDDDDDDDDGGDGHAYRKKKPIRPAPKEHKYPSVNELKRRIRDVKRLLNRADLPADARIVQERALAGYEKDLEEELKRRNRSEMIKKYHFVRFLGMSHIWI